MYTFPLSFNDKKLIFQSTAAYDTKCDQIFELDWTVPNSHPVLVKALSVLYVLTHLTKKTPKMRQYRAIRDTNEISRAVQKLRMKFDLKVTHNFLNSLYFEGLQWPRHDDLLVFLSRFSSQTLRVDLFVRRTVPGEILLARTSEK